MVSPLPSRCGANVVAKTTLELLALPRAKMMRMLHANPELRTRLVALANVRRQENDYFRRGNVASREPNLSAKIMAAYQLTRAMRRALVRRRRRKEVLATMGAEGLSEDHEEAGEGERMRECGGGGADEL